MKSYDDNAKEIVSKLFSDESSAITYCEQGDYEAAKRRIFKAGANVNYRRFDDKTILMVATGNSIFTRQLIEAGANVNDKDKNGKTPLFFAVSENNYESVKLLIEAGASLNENINNITILDYAVFFNKFESVKELIAGIDNKTTEYSINNALKYAKRKDEKELFETITKIAVKNKIVSSDVIMNNFIGNNYSFYGPFSVYGTPAYETYLLFVDEKEQYFYIDISSYIDKYHITGYIESINKTAEDHYVIDGSSRSTRIFASEKWVIDILYDKSIDTINISGKIWRDFHRNIVANSIYENDASEKLIEFNIPDVWSKLVYYETNESLKLKVNADKV